MTQAHGWLAIVVLLAAVAALVGAIALRAGRRDAHRWVDRAILAALAVIALDGLLGLGLVALGHAPTDLLHVVYGVAALVVLPVARWAERSADRRRRALWIAGGSLVLIGILVRLAQTG